MTERIPDRCPITDLCTRIQDATRRYLSPDPEYAELAEEITCARNSPLGDGIFNCALISLAPNIESCVYTKYGRGVAKRIIGYNSTPD